MPHDAATTVRQVPAPLDAPVAAQVRALARAAARHDGAAPLSEQPLLRLGDASAPVVHVLAVRTRPDETSDRSTEELVGYAQLDVGSSTTATAELVVAPDHRRRGVGAALLDALRLLAVQVPGRRLHVWAHGDLEPARAAARTQRLPVVRELLLLGVDLEQSPPEAPALPAGVQVRAFVPDQDEEAWRRVNARAFAHHPEQGRMTAQDLRARQAEPWFDPAGLLLAERDGVLLGSVWTKVHPAGEAPGAAPDEQVGEIYVLGVDPDAQGLGLGRALTGRGLAHLRSVGVRRVLLYVEASSTVAVHTYRRAGFATVSADVVRDATGPAATTRQGHPGDAPPLDTTRSPSGATMGS